jgi:DinB superfamily
MSSKQAGQQGYQELVMSLEETPRLISQMVSDVAENSLSERPQDKSWSILEHICHLRDIEQEGYSVRITRILNEDQPFLSDLDGDKLALERDYINQDFRVALEAFIATRALNVDRIRHLSPDRLSRGAEFENVGHITLLDLLTKIREHDWEHIKELTALHNRYSG